jgi:hypothetical protein
MRRAHRWVVTQSHRTSLAGEQIILLYQSMFCWLGAHNGGHRENCLSRNRRWRDIGRQLAMIWRGRHP